MCRVVVDYFKNHFKEIGWSIHTLEGLNFPTLSLEQSSNLTKSITFPTLWNSPTPYFFSKNTLTLIQII